MSWTDHAVWWHVYPLGALGAPIREGHDHAHRLPRLVAWLDYADSGMTGWAQNGDEAAFSRADLAHPEGSWSKKAVKSPFTFDLEREGRWLEEILADL